MKGIILKPLDNSLVNITNTLEIIIKNLSNKYNWLISDLQATNYFPNKYNVGKDCDWINSLEMIDNINSNNIQFLWGVFSGFTKEVQLHNILEYSIPFADGNSDLWNETINIQNPLASIEIIIWHYTYIILIAKDDDIINKVIDQYPDAKDLVKFSKEQNRY